MTTDELSPTRIPPEAVAYATLLQELRAYVDELGIEEMPDAAKRLTFSVDARRPSGALIPLYSPENLSSNDGGIQCVLFNLRALTGFVPPQKNR